jgi:uncharacterized protein YecT (DUF1311 family)
MYRFWEMKSLKLLVAAFATITIGSTSQLHALECKKALTKIEFTICENAELKNIDQITSNLYFNILKTLPSDLKQSLVHDQREWLKARDSLCNNENNIHIFLSCIKDQTKRRKNSLSSRFVDVAYGWDVKNLNSTKSLAHQFAGNWQNSYFLYQSKNRICGKWLFTASNLQYEGRLVANINGNRAVIKAVCGRLNSDITKECPNGDKVYSNEGWKNQVGILFLKKNKLFGDLACVGSSAGCTPQDQSAGLAKNSKNLLDYDNYFNTEPWVKKCLFNPNFPN